jgi:hypothetical protein
MPQHFATALVIRASSSASCPALNRSERRLSPSALTARERESWEGAENVEMCELNRARFGRLDRCPLSPQGDSSRPLTHDAGYAGYMTLFDLLTQTAKADTDLLRQNDQAGDAFATPREVDFAFESAERENADDFAEFVNGKQYGRATVTNLEGGRCRILVFITMPVTQHLICSVSGFMLCLSRIFLIDYQGWGSVIQKP